MKTDKKVIEVLDFAYVMFLNLPIYVKLKKSYTSFRRNWKEIKEHYEITKDEFFRAESFQFHTYPKDIGLDKCEFCSPISRYETFIEQNYNDFLEVSNKPKLNDKKRFDKYMELLKNYYENEPIIKDEVLLFGFINNKYPSYLLEEDDYHIFNIDEEADEFNIAFINGFHIKHVITDKLSTYNEWIKKENSNWHLYSKEYHKHYDKRDNKYLEVFASYKQKSKKSLRKYIDDYSRYKVGDIVLTQKSRDFGEIVKIEQTKKSPKFTIYEKSEDRTFTISHRASCPNIRLKTDNFSLFTKKAWWEWYDTTWPARIIYQLRDEMALRRFLGYGIAVGYDDMLDPYSDNFFLKFVSPNLADLMITISWNTRGDYEYLNKKYSHLKHEFEIQIREYLSSLNIGIPDFLEALTPELEKNKKEYIEITAKPVPEGKKLDIKQSKFVGKPYLPEGVSYPYMKLDNGEIEYMTMIAQINFSEVPKNNFLPESGILQLFCVNYLSNFLRPDRDDVYAVKYWEDTDSPASKINKELINKCSPMSEELELSFIKRVEYEEICNAKSFGKYGAKYIDLYEDFFSISTSKYTHKLGGKASLANLYEYPKNKDDMLLLQIVSDLGTPSYINIADGGIMHVGINKEDLKNKNFEKAYYSYDST